MEGAIWVPSRSGARVASVKTPVGQISTGLPPFFENAVLGASVEDVVAQVERVEVLPGVFAIVADAALALDAAIHLVVDQRTEVLITEGSFAKLYVRR
jgi:hypothetical protein